MSRSRWPTESEGMGRRGRRSRSLAGDWSATDACMSVRLNLTGSKPVNSPKTGSNRTGFAVASEAQRPPAAASQVPPMQSMGGQSPARHLFEKPHRLRSFEGGAGLAIPWARATRSLGRPSLDARTEGTRQATPPMSARGAARMRVSRNRPAKLENIE
jgi:hypothetical protein